MIHFKKALLIRLICLALTITGLNSTSLFAQMGRNMERIKAERVAFFTEQLKLSPAEAEKFWPLYNDYTARRAKLVDEERMLIKFVNSNYENMEEEEIEENLSKYIDLKTQSDKLFISYNDKFLKALPASKVLKLYITETRFKQYLLQKIGDTRRERQGGGSRF